MSLAEVDECRILTVEYMTHKLLWVIIYDILYDFQVSYGECRKASCFVFSIFSHRESFFVCKPFVLDFSIRLRFFDPIDKIDPIDWIDSKLFHEVAAAELSNIDVGAKSEQGKQSRPKLIFYESDGHEFESPWSQNF